MIEMKKYKVGYTQGVYDMFHIGHLNIIKHAKEQCEYLIVGINSDNLVQNYKNKLPVINENDRMEIVRNIRDVDEVVLADTLDKEQMLRKLSFNAIFIGSDWQNDPRWIETKNILRKYDVDVVFLPHTDGITSTILREVKEKQVSE